MTRTNTSKHLTLDLEDFFNSTVEVIRPRRYSVILHKHGDAAGVMKTGWVVTHLNIWDWCQMNEYWLIKLYPNDTRNAQANERTDLF